jgi:hypothetical protein
VKSISRFPESPQQVPEPDKLDRQEERGAHGGKVPVVSVVSRRES